MPSTFCERCGLLPAMFRSKKDAARLCGGHE